MGVLPIDNIDWHCGARSPLSMKGGLPSSAPLRRESGGAFEACRGPETTTQTRSESQTVPCNRVNALTAGSDILKC